MGKENSKPAGYDKQKDDGACPSSGGGKGPDDEKHDKGSSIIVVFLQDRGTQTYNGDSKDDPAVDSPEPPYVRHELPAGITAEQELQRRKLIAKKALIYGGAFGTAATVLGVGTFVVLNVVVPGLGFAAGGIVAGSYAAGMMSSAAVASGGAIAAGSTVAVLQSIGATGVAVGTCAGIGTAAAAAGTAAAAAGEATVDGIRHLNANKTNDAGTQTDVSCSMHYLT